MEFELHRKCRYNTPTKDEYDRCLREYVQHLANIDFSRAKPLLKYFGFSFFHDAVLKSLFWAGTSHSLELMLYSRNDMEDINDLHRKNGSDEITWKAYSRDPILYTCVFKGVPSLAFDTEPWQRDATIMDSELRFEAKSGLYEVAISFSAEKELRFACKACTVRIDNPQKIMEYTGGKAKNMPYCEECRYRLLTTGKIQEYLGALRGRP